MARLKFTPGTKTSRPKANKEQAENPVVPEVNPVAATEAEIAPVVTAQVSQTSAASGAKGEHSGSNGGPEANRNSESNGNSELRKFELMKPETVKTDSRKNLVPINLEDEIRRRAYEIYEQRDAASGDEADDWFRAEREVRQRYRQQSA
ncbi:MAG: DUF2934 domain-containing protein [Candidatus Sulfotelmatobacter sp.]